MRVVAEFSFKGGKEAVNARYSHLIDEVYGSIAAIDARSHKTKESKELTMPGQMLYSPRSLNKAFKSEFGDRKWKTIKVECDYPSDLYIKGYDPRSSSKGAFREMDFVKEKLGIEVQFGKYAFMVYNVCAKMTIFRNLGVIDTGIEIVPVKGFADEMSTGVSYFEQFTWDLKHRGHADIDIPVLILGIDD
jgi:hypothetical protein